MSIVTPPERIAPPESRRGRGRPPAALDDRAILRDALWLMMHTVAGWPLARIADADGVCESTVRRGVDRARDFAALTFASRSRAASDPSFEDDDDDDAERAERNRRRRVGRGRPSDD